MNRVPPNSPVALRVRAREKATEAQAVREKTAERRIPLWARVWIAYAQLHVGVQLTLFIGALYVFALLAQAFPIVLVITAFVGAGIWMAKGYGPLAFLSNTAKSIQEKGRK